MGDAEFDRFGRPAKRTGIRWCHVNAGSGNHAFHTPPTRRPRVEQVYAVKWSTPEEVKTIGVLTYCEHCVRSNDAARRYLRSRSRGALLVLIELCHANDGACTLVIDGSEQVCSLAQAQAELDSRSQELH